MSGRPVGLTYDDALRLLGKGDSKVIRWADRLRSLASVGTAVAGFGDLFDLGDELMRWARGIQRHFDERAIGAGRYDRTQLIEAAHAVLVVSSFQEAVAAVAGDRASALRALRSAGGVPDEMAETWRTKQYYLVDTMYGAQLPLPSPTRPYERTLDDLVDYYRGCTDRLATVLLAPGMGPDQDISVGLVVAALHRYQAGFRNLASSVPEFAFWSTTIDSQATRQLVAELGDQVTTALAGVSALLATVDRPHATVDVIRAELAQLYRGRLDRPLLELPGVSDGLTLPSLAAAYVNPPCRIATERPAAWPLGEKEWSEQPLVSDIQRYLAGYLTSSEATRSPQVIYGQPGSGKSSLSKILAARLPERSFLTLVVPLRDVPADAIVSEQIAAGLRREAGESVSWSTLSRSLDGALPVVILDGLDEMLQASATDRAGYLEEVRAFQHDEADRGRPVAVIVTSRPAVAQRVRVPADASLLRLEPFDRRHITAWVRTWNDLTASSRGHDRELSVDAVLDYAEIAEQPLLLLLIALYDWRTDGLRQLSARSQAGLFEAVLRDYTLREVRRASDSRSDEEEEWAVELDLRRLGVASLAMINRGALAITAEELQSDLQALDHAVTDRRNADRRTAYDVVSSFYFMYSSRATVGVDTQRRSFEFLHSTVGEYLAARLIMRSLAELADDRTSRSTWSEPDAGLLRAATSFEVISDRPQVADFCEQMAHDLSDAEREAQSLVLRDLIATCLDDHRTWSFEDYVPVHSRTVHRQAAMSANLVVLYVLLRPEETPVEDLCDDLSTFRSVRGLWWSQLGWLSANSIVAYVRAKHRVVGTQLTVSREDGDDVRLYDSISVVNAPDHTIFTDVTLPAGGEEGLMFRRLALFGDEEERRATVALASYWRHLGPGGHSRSRDSGGGIAAASLLLELLLRPRSDREARARIYQYVLNVQPPWMESLVFVEQVRLDARLLGDHKVDELLLPAIEAEAVSPADFRLVLVEMSDPGVFLVTLRELLTRVPAAPSDEQEYLTALIEEVKAVTGGGARR